MNRIAVIDTETTWGDEVMSIGIAVADTADFALIDMRYYILTLFRNHGGMYTGFSSSGAAISQMVRYYEAGGLSAV